jgi:hypothetical protein
MSTKSTRPRKSPEEIKRNRAAGALKAKATRERNKAERLAKIAAGDLTVQVKTRKKRDKPLSDKQKAALAKGREIRRANIAAKNAAKGK